MVDAAITRMVIYDSVLFQYGGQVHRWAVGLENRFTWNARQEAPINKRPFKSTWRHLAAWAYRGALRENIHGDVEKVGPKHWRTIIRSDAPYSMHVLRGTDTITPVSSNYLWLPRNPGHGRHAQKHSSVRGQQANNFLSRAAAATARRHPSIRGFQHHI